MSGKIPLTRYMVSNLYIVNKGGIQEKVRMCLDSRSPNKACSLDTSCELRVKCISQSLVAN